jgi:hypothetical protein
MNRIKTLLLLAAGVFVLALFVPYTGESADKLERGAHRRVEGTVQKITKDSFVLKTEEGTLRNFSFKEVEKEEVGDIKIGDRLVVEFDEGNQIVDIDRMEGEMGEAGERHPVVTGEIVGFDRTKKEVTLKLKDGKSQSYQMKDAAATKMSGVKIGTVVLMELDEENNLVNDFDVKR